MRDILYFVLFFVIAGAIAYGFDAIFSSLLPSNASSFFVKPYSIGIHPISVSISVCGILGIVITYALTKFIRR